MSDEQFTGLDSRQRTALSRTRDKGAAALSIADAGSRQAFFDAWMRNLSSYAKRLRVANTELAKPVFVVHMENCEDVSNRTEWSRRPTLGASPHEDLAGVLAISNAGVGGYVYQDTLPSGDAFENALIAQNLTDRPTMMLATNSKLIIWPDGITSDQPHLERDFQDSAMVVDIAAIDHQLNRFYELIARQCKHWWKDAQKYIAKENPEGLVQLQLWDFLICAFGDYARVKEEENIGNGRADITIWPHDKVSSNESAVLELKTLRDFRTPKPETIEPGAISESSNVKWACSGVQQTAAYRDQEHMDAAFLCLYDFRRKNCSLIDAKIKATADTYQVIPRRYWITASHGAHRAERYPAIQN